MPSNVSAAPFLSLEQFQARFSKVLRRYVDERIRATKITTKDDLIGRALGYIRTVVFSGGKRLRPYVMYLGYRSAGGRDEKAIMQAAVAVELFHIFCLLQDDVIDKAVERHGVRTLHEFIRGSMQQRNATGDVRHIAEGEAILISDLLFGWSQDIIETSLGFSSSRRVEALKIFRVLRDEVILGQLLDVDTTTRPSIPTPLIRTKLILKSARYSFVRPMQLGAAYAGGGLSFKQFADRFGTSLGVAFQAQDDVLDIISDSRAMGKSVLSDLRQHQHTPLTQFVLTRGNYIYRKQLLHWFGGDVEPRDRGAVVEMFTRSGAVEAVQAMIDVELKKAQDVLRTVRLSASAKQAWQELVARLHHRTS